jgi:hypothetical protein
MSPAARKPHTFTAGSSSRNRDRLALFARGDVEVRRIALNMDLVELYRPPPNPAKEADSRYAAYVSQFGPDCWELDALRPDVSYPWGCLPPGAAALPLWRAGGPHASRPEFA